MQAKIALFLSLGAAEGLQMVKKEDQCSNAIANAELSWSAEEKFLRRSDGTHDIDINTGSAAWLLVAEGCCNDSTLADRLHNLDIDNGTIAHFMGKYCKKCAQSEIEKVVSQGSSASIGDPTTFLSTVCWACDKSSPDLVDSAIKTFEKCGDDCSKARAQVCNAAPEIAPM
jgi:hypothetical protein